ncbi:MAG: heme-copper oxidase subunit III [Pedosphaera sp.]|nr:heme-copper oxidase subunit III [Pedosphaera sp.]
MEIPYAVQPREDTGLYNAKLGIWLFLASEVMLFGALFSSYILLRVGAAPGAWPHGLLNIPIGTLNTLVLITSSVTVVMAWASLKMNQLSRFKMYQTLTVLFALTFVCIKSYEYHDKFTHYEVVLKDGKSMTGHIEGSPMLWNLTKLNVKKIPSITFTPEAAHGSHDAKSEGAAGASAHGEPTKIATSDIVKLECFGPFHNTYLAIYFTLTALHALHVIGGAIVIGYILFTSGRWWKKNPEQLTNRVEVSGLFWHFVDLVWIFLFPVLYLL